MLLYQLTRGTSGLLKSCFDGFSRAACAFVNRYIPEHDAVEDVVQETFINLWEKRGVYTDMVYFKAYLYKSLRDNTIFYLRQHRVSEEVDPGIEDETGSSQEEIAEKLNVSVNTIKTQKRKAYAFLREELQHLFVFFVMLVSL